MSRLTTGPQAPAPRYLVYPKGPAPLFTMGRLIVRRVRIVQDGCPGGARPQRFEGFAVLDHEHGHLTNLFVVRRNGCVLEWQLEPLPPDAPRGVLPVRHSARRRVTVPDAEVEP